MDDQSQQLVEALKNANSVLVTTNKNPTVDEASSAIGLAYMLESIKKHATVVISSPLPKSLDFLETDKIVEQSTDKLRDYVISFSKDKADKLRYKVEDDQVKVFVTPYKTVITKDDFNFSQGDFNVDTIVALGATKRDELDEAVLKHGRVLHEATVLTINAGKEKTPGIGSINWIDHNASSIAEMLVQISDSLGEGVIQKASAQALLTALIYTTDKFSNHATTPKVMTLAAQLMDAGADQRTIMQQLRLETKSDAVADEEKPAKSSSPKDDKSQDKDVSSQKKDGDVMIDLGSARKEAATKPSVQVVSDSGANPQSDNKPKPAQPGSGGDKSTQPQTIEDKIAEKLKQTQPEQPAEPTTPPREQEVSRHAFLDDDRDSGQDQILSHKVAGQDKSSQDSTDQQAPGSESVNHPPSGGAGLFRQSQQGGDGQHVNVHPSIPVLHSSSDNEPHGATSTPPQTSQSPQASQAQAQPQPPQASSQQSQGSQNTQSSPSAGVVKDQPTPAQPAGATPAKPQSEASSQPGDSGKADANASGEDHEKDLAQARKAVQAAIADQGSPLPTPRQSSGSQPMQSNDQDSHDIYIDHQGNLRQASDQQGKKQ